MDINIDEIARGKISEEQSEILQKHFKAGGTWQELLELDDAQVEELYQKGYAFYQEEEYDKAISAFSSLIQLNPYKYTHWLAMGGALHAKEHYEDALAAYELALAMNETSVHGLFFSAQALYALGEKERCSEFLEKVITVAGHSEEERAFKEKAEILREVL